MKFLTVEQMRDAEQAAAEAEGIPSMALMRRAGVALARVAAQFAGLRNTRKVVLVAGHGNNGGDACVAARCLHEDGFRVQVLLTCLPERLRGDAYTAWIEMRMAEVPDCVLASAGDWDDPASVAQGLMDYPCVVVDGVLGSGCKGAPRDVAERAIRWVNRMRGHALVVSADLPSGVDGDTGEMPGEAVRADVTVTFGRPKACFREDAVAARAGHLVVADIGVGDDGVGDGVCGLIALPELQARFPSLPWAAHKGTCGHVCVVGGSSAYPHAPVLAALGALKSGAGRVTLAVPPQSAYAAAAWAPEVILCPLNAVPERLDTFDALVVGPGLTQAPDAVSLVALLSVSDRRVVLDADGLNALAQLRGAGAWSPRDDQQLMLTPHPGEAARLLGCAAEDIQSDRMGAVRKLADTYQAVAVLKGAGTLVCAPGGKPLINRTGNPGMATGGAGDVLAGMAAALWARHDDALHAAATAVWAHGTAGDLAALAQGPVSLTATTLAQCLPVALRDISRF